jgi:hypothetical protein
VFVPVPEFNLEPRSGTGEGDVIRVRLDDTERLGTALGDQRHPSLVHQRLTQRGQQAGIVIDDENGRALCRFGHRWRD